MVFTASQLDVQKLKRQSEHRDSQDFLLGGANHKLHAMTPSKIFKRGTFFGERYRRMEDQKPWPGLALKQGFAKGRGLKPTVEKRKCLIWETLLSKRV